jgi:hypothetical protein
MIFRAKWFFDSLIPFFFALLLPAALFAQNQPGGEMKMLKQFGLDDSKVSQVMDIQTKTMTTVRQDRVRVRLLKAQMAQALLPAKADMQAVNDLVNQEAQTRADMQKALLGARVQLRQIMGEDNFRVYMRHRMAMYRHRSGERERGFGNGRMPQRWPLMDGNQQGS